MCRPTALVTACVLLLTAEIAGAASLQVSYTVEDKALKSAISGTTLTFALYSDPACTTAVDAENVVVDDVDLIERVKRFTPKGGTKGPAAARLIEVLSSVTTAPIVYLTVTGTGVTPIGGACQLQYASADNVGTVLPCASQTGTEVVFEGCNVNVRNGGGYTGAVNGLGNLIVGYNEDYDLVEDRSGSHNLVIGELHSYTRYGGLVAGYDNTLTGDNASVTGGEANTASYYASSVAGGVGNAASGFFATVSGGYLGVASGRSSVVSGGVGNRATADNASVSGGECNVAGSEPALICNFIDTVAPTVSGGRNNLASGSHATVSGGLDNAATGASASISGGVSNTASGTQSSVTGGLQNTASGLNASVAGGWNNTATGQNTSVSGGQFRSAGGPSDWAAGGLFQDF